MPVSYATQKMLGNRCRDNMTGVRQDRIDCLTHNSRDSP